MAGGRRLHMIRYNAPGTMKKIKPNRIATISKSRFVSCSKEC